MQVFLYLTCLPKLLWQSLPILKEPIAPAAMIQGKEAEAIVAATTARQLEHVSKKLDLALSNCRAKEGQAYVYALKVRDLERQNVSLHIRLCNQIKRPGSLDLDHDPSHQHGTDKVGLNLSHASCACKLLNFILTLVLMHVFSGVEGLLGQGIVERQRGANGHGGQLA
jgi:hypothetical protein